MKRYAVKRNGRNKTVAILNYDEENKICISTPAVVGASGIKKKIFIPLKEDEKNKLINSINVIKEAINSIE